MSFGSLVGLILYIMGLIVYFLKPNTSTSWTFLVLCFNLGTMILAGLENQTSYILVPFFYTINTLYAFNFLHLFLERKRILEKFPDLEYLIYLPAVILIVAFQVYFTIFQDIFSGGSWSWFPTYKELGSILHQFLIGGEPGPGPAAEDILKDGKIDLESDNQDHGRQINEIFEGGEFLQDTFSFRENQKQVQES